MDIKYVLPLSALLLIGCKSEGPKGESEIDAISREAMCVISSERFALYDDAKAHLQHGQEAAYNLQVKSGQPVNFSKDLHHIRSMLISQSKEIHQRTLETMCSRELKVFEFEQVE